MNSIASILSMIESNARDFGGLQEIPEHRIGPEYRFSVVKRLGRQKVTTVPKKIIKVEKIDDGCDEIEIFKMNYTLCKKLDDEGNLWFEII